MTHQPTTIPTLGVTPTKAHPDDAGFDLYASHSITIPSMGNTLVDTGVAIALPPGMVADIRSRSGLAYKNQVFVLNAPGTIDPGYTGPIKANLMNLGRKPYTIQKGERVAQLVFIQTAPVHLQPVDELPTTARGQAGHGSTGN